jgi:predicted TIM-barrel fold metal-dependent hydrolase
LRKLYYDTASASSQPSMAALRAMAPASNILFGSDYPFVKAAAMVEELRHVAMSEGEREAIERGKCSSPAAAPEGLTDRPGSLTSATG